MTSKLIPMATLLGGMALMSLPSEAEAARRWEAGPWPLSDARGETAWVCRSQMFSAHFRLPSRIRDYFESDFHHTSVALCPEGEVPWQTQTRRGGILSSARVVRDANDKCQFFGTQPGHRKFLPEQRRRDVQCLPSRVPASVVRSRLLMHDQPYGLPSNHCTTSGEGLTGYRPWTAPTPRAACADTLAQMGAKSTPNATTPKPKPKAKK